MAMDNAIEGASRASPSEGTDQQFFQDVRATIPDFFFSTIFDVGANVGQSSLSFCQQAPKAKIFAFEPVPKTFEKLTQNVANIRNIRVFPLALGAKPGQVTITARGTSTMNRVVPAKSVTGDTTRVEVTTGDRICEEHGIDQISFLKIDTEGYDLEVLAGFERMLKTTDFIQVEASMNTYNTYHVPFQQVMKRMFSQGFMLFRIYDQTFEWQNSGQPVLRRANLIFINGSMVNVTGITNSRTGRR